MNKKRVLPVIIALFMVMLFVFFLLIMHEEMPRYAITVCEGLTKSAEDVRVEGSVKHIRPHQRGVLYQLCDGECCMDVLGDSSSMSVKNGQSVIVTGHWEGNDFRALRILTRCDR